MQQLSLEFVKKLSPRNRYLSLGTTDFMDYLDPEELEVRGITKKDSDNIKRIVKKEEYVYAFNIFNDYDLRILTESLIYNFGIDSLTYILNFDKAVSEIYEYMFFDLSDFVPKPTFLRMVLLPEVFEWYTRIGTMSPETVKHGLGGTTEHKEIKGYIKNIMDKCYKDFELYTKLPADVLVNGVNSNLQRLYRMGLNAATIAVRLADIYLKHFSILDGGKDEYLKKLQLLMDSNPRNKYEQESATDLKVTDQLYKINRLSGGHTND